MIDKLDDLLIYKRIANEYLDDIINASKVFYKENIQRKGIDNTFGYFTNHIVAPLNQKRLFLIICFLLYIKEHEQNSIKVLDIASGGGIITRAIAGLGFPIIGIDNNIQEIEIAKDFSAFFPTDNFLKFLNIDIINNSQWEKTIEKIFKKKPDIVILSYALHHFPNVNKFIDRLFNWLNSESKIIVNEENPLSPLFQLKHWIRTFLQKDTSEENHKTFLGWKKLMKDSGFTVYNPIGIDPIIGISKMLSNFCWSIVFLAEK